MSIRSTIVVLAVVLASSAAFAQTVDYTTILLPVTPSSVQGANGASWVTELTLSNNDFSAIPLFCFTGTDCSAIGARAVWRVPTPPAASVRPGLMYVPTSQVRRLGAALRSRNTTPNSEERDFVSEIPVVREDEFRTNTIEILAVPIEANYRHMLRVYDASAMEEAQVRVRIWGLDATGTPSSDALVDQTLTLRTSRGAASPYAMPDEPSWAQLADFAELGGLRGYREAHIRIESLSGDRQIWAFVTATNNTTQRFAVYTP